MTSSRNSTCVTGSRFIRRTFSRVYTFCESAIAPCLGLSIEQLTLMQQFATSSMTRSNLFQSTATHCAVFDVFGSAAVLPREVNLAALCVPSEPSCQHILYIMLGMTHLFQRLLFQSLKRRTHVVSEVTPHRSGRQGGLRRGPVGVGGCVPFGVMKRARVDSEPSAE